MRIKLKTQNLHPTDFTSSIIEHRDSSSVPDLLSTVDYQSTTKLCIIIPCHNEENAIGKLVYQVASEFPDSTIVVINDASSDKSAEIIKITGKAILLDLPVNLGIGGAIQTGIMYAKENNFDYLVRIDGDGQHPVSEIRKVLAPIFSGEADMSIGSRFISSIIGHTPNFKSTPLRRVGIHTFRLLNRLIIGQTITDSTSGFRSYNRKLIEYLAENYPSFDYPEPEEITLLGINGYKIKEVSVNMAEREHGSSSINAIKSIYYMVKVVFAIFITASRPKIKREV